MLRSPRAPSPGHRTAALGWARGFDRSADFGRMQRGFPDDTRWPSRGAGPAGAPAGVGGHGGHRSALRRIARLGAIPAPCQRRGRFWPDGRCCGRGRSGSHPGAREASGPRGVTFAQVLTVLVMPRRCSRCARSCRCPSTTCASRSAAPPACSVMVPGLRRCDVRRPAVRRGGYVACGGWFLRPSAWACCTRHARCRSRAGSLGAYATGAAALALTQALRGGV